MQGSPQLTPLGERFDLSENALPYYRHFREAGSVIPNDGWIPTPADWIATDLETVQTIFRRPDLFSSAAGSSPSGNIRPMIPLEVDPPDHHRYRRLLDPFFSPTKLRDLEPVLRRQINTYIDGFIDDGEVDLLEAFFIPYPTQVFLTLYGLPLEDLPTFLRWKDDILHHGLLDPAVLKAASDELYAYMTRFVETCDVSGSNLMSSLLQPDENGDRLSLEEILDITYVFILAGLHTVTTMLALSFAYLGRHPEQRRLIVEDLSIIPVAVEELLRMTTPAPALSRVATEDVEIGGVTIAKGQSVYCHIGAANADTTGCPNAEELDLLRADNRHATFGLGVHRCLGSHLARIEIRLVLDEFLRRIPDYEIAPDADLVRVPFYEGMDRLPIIFPPGGRR